MCPHSPTPTLVSGTHYLARHVLLMHDGGSKRGCTQLHPARRAARCKAGSQPLHTPTGWSPPVQLTATMAAHHSRPRLPLHCPAVNTNINGAASHIEDVIQYIRTAHPFWNRAQGRDHVFWLTNDRGACGILPDSPAEPPIKLVHFAYQYVGEGPIGK